MRAVLLGTAENHSAEWYAMRHGGIGSSDIAALVGDSKYGTPYSVWTDKMADAKDGTEDDSNRWQEWGTRLEDVIAAKFADEHPEFDVRPTGTWRHGEREWQRANPDRLLYAGPDDTEYRGVLEIKTAATDYGWESGVPEMYRAQITWQADVLGVSEVWVAVLIAGSDYREYLVQIDPFDTERLRHVGQRFWEDNVLAFNPPPLDGENATLAAVWRHTPPFEADKKVEIPAEIATEYREAKAALVEAEKRDKAATAAVVIALGDGKIALDPDGQRVAYRKSFERSGIDATALREAYPEIATAVTKYTHVDSLTKGWRDTK